jgi:hypothetical protein
MPTLRCMYDDLQTHSVDPGARPSKGRIHAPKPSKILNLPYPILNTFLTLASLSLRKFYTTESSPNILISKYLVK